MISKAVLEISNFKDPKYIVNSGKNYALGLGG